MTHRFYKNLRIKAPLSITLLLFALTNFDAQKLGHVDHAKAPNSYIYDVDAAKANKYGGFYIPVAKAFDVVKSEFYRDPSKEISAGNLTVNVHWEDVAGLIDEVSIDGPNSRFGRIKVKVNNTKGKGNAVVALMSNNEIVWSWHIWVTDNPKDGVEYYHGLRATDANGGRFIEQYMDRNLGATSAEFLGNDWNNSGGLKYQWGRKDPFPSLIKKDFTFYELNGSAGNIRHHELDLVTGYSQRIVNKVKANEILDNIDYAIKNPLTPIISLSPTEPWYSSQSFVTGVTTHNLWADNTNGNNSSSTSVRDKSVYDPCPNGWRVPAFVSQRSMQNSYSPLGYPNSNAFNSNQGNINPYSSNALFPHIKIYPMLGFDFGDNKTIASHPRGMGLFPLNGKYQYYHQGEFYQQDESAEVSLWSATSTVQGQARGFTMINDVGRRDNNGAGLFRINSHALSPIGQTMAGVRCMKDPNYLINTNTHKSYNFETTFFREETINDRDVLKQPNSYLVKPGENRDLLIPTAKAFAAQEFLFNKESQHQSLKVNIVWTSNPDLVKTINLQNSATRKDIKVELNPQQYGNTVVSLEDANKNTLWSWLIWAPKEDPTQNEVTYTTENSINTTNVVNLTQSGLPPLTTTFMDRNMGAIEAFPTELANSPNNPILLAKAKESAGLQYQWGRKDPLPSFINVDGSAANIFVDPVITPNSGNVTNYKDLSVDQHLNNFTINNFSKLVHAEAIDKDDKLAKVIEKSVQNPLSILVETNQKDWISPISSLAEDRWGHATEKSIYDPCPEGWRVPDVSFVYTESSPKYNNNNDPIDARGSSPWYFGETRVNNQEGVPQQLFFNVEQVYKGKRVLNGADVQGWVFNSNDYNIGAFPATGARNYKGDNNLPSELPGFSGIWTSALAERMKGTPITMLFKNSNLLTASGKYEDVYPQAALNVRCAKDLPRYDGLSKKKNSRALQVGEDILDRGQNILDVYPNPFVEVINVKNKEVVAYEIYDMSGKLLLNGTLKDQKIYTKQLQKGLYVLQLVKENDVKVSRKIIK